MKRIFYFIILIIISFTTINIKASENDLEYLNVTYNFIDKKHYEVTYEFKLNELREHTTYYFKAEKIQKDSFEYNVDNFTTKINSDFITFNLNDKKDYYIKYKGYINAYTYQMSINPILNSYPRYYFDNSDSLSTDYFKLMIVNPSYINLTKENIYNIDNYSFIDDNNVFVIDGIDDNHSLSNYKYISFKIKDVPYTQTYEFIQKKERIKNIVLGLIIFTPVIIAIIVAIYDFVKYLINKIKSKLIKNN